MMDMELLGDRVRALRRERKLSTLSLAEQAGLTARTVEYVEAGRDGVRLATVVAISEALGVPLAEILEGVA